MKKIFSAVLASFFLVSVVYAELTELEKAKIAFSDASINLEIAQGRYNEAKAKLIQELQKPPVIMKQKLEDPNEPIVEDK